MKQTCLCLCVLGAFCGVAAGGEAANKQGVSQVAAYHARGQTFVTWKEMRSGGSDAEYHIFRSAKSFDGRAPLNSERVGIVRGNSAGLLYEQCAENYGHGLTSMAILDRSRGGRPLRKGTGLFVWTIKKEGARYYCVLAHRRDGYVETSGAAGRNTTARALSEAPGERAAIELADTGPAGWYYLLYGDFRKLSRKGLDDLWGGYAWSFHVALPPDAKRSEKLPVRVTLHGYRAQGVRYSQVPIKKRLVYISAQDWQNSFWWGWSRSIRPAGPAAWPPAKGKPTPGGAPIQPFAAKRVGSIVNWAAANPANLTAQTDAKRIYLYGHSIGGTGALNYVLSAQPGAEKVAAVVATKFPTSWPAGCYWEKALERVWGARKLGLPAEGFGPKSAFDTVTPVALAGRAAVKPLAFEPPLVEISLGTKDKYAPVTELAKLCAALEAARVPYFAHWGDYGHNGGRLSGAKNRAFDVRLDEPLLALAKVSCNGNPDKEPVGYFNSALEWSSPGNDFDRDSQADNFLDTEKLCAFSVRLVTGTSAEFRLPKGTDHVTADITPRRLQKFKFKPGANYTWRALKPDPKVPSAAVTRASGRVTADARGRLTLLCVPVLKLGTGTRVEIRLEAAKAKTETPTPPKKDDPVDDLLKGDL
jgi:hypothetical protein